MKALSNLNESGGSVGILVKDQGYSIFTPMINPNPCRFVVLYGRDCDGFCKTGIYVFNSEKEAQAFSDDCNGGSDGIIYTPVAADDAKKYFNEEFDWAHKYNDWEEFLTINTL